MTRLATILLLLVVLRRVERALAMLGRIEQRYVPTPEQQQELDAALAQMEQAVPSHA